MTTSEIMAGSSVDDVGFAFHGEEEPLFADDLGDYDDDDLGRSTLPPPMPSLSELTEMQSHNGNIDGSTRIPGFDVGRGADPSGNGSNDQGPPLKKRKPILTLKIDRIFSDKGLPYIQKEFPKLKFKGKGHELSDLKHLMRQYEHWANMLYPKMTFSDVTDRIEALAKKREFKTQLIRMRRKMVRGGADTPPLSDNEDDSVSPPQPPPVTSPPPDDKDPNTAPRQSMSPSHRSLSPTVSPSTQIGLFTQPNTLTTTPSSSVHTDTSSQPHTPSQQDEQSVMNTSSTEDTNNLAIGTDNNSTPLDCTDDIEGSEW